MRFFLTGVETNNKGAELMFYAILQEIERKYPGSTVFIDINNISQGVNYINSNVRIISIDSKLRRLLYKFHVNGVLQRLHLPLINIQPSIPEVEYMIDGSGLHFTDQMTSEYATRGWIKIFKNVKRYNAKIVFLSQGFGPIERDYTRYAVSNLFKYADLVCPREQVSYNYLKKCGNLDMSKAKIYTDFTSLVNGTYPQQYSHLKGAVCVIPNMQMVRKGIVNLDGYIEYIGQVIKEVANCGKRVYILNHEGKGDEDLMNACKLRLGDSVETVTGINALDVKGLISTAYLVITSRFHGAASALNSCVPCLATSWSHKYQCLFEDYKQTECVLSINNLKADLVKINEFLNPEKNTNIRLHLAKQLPHIKEETKRMWEEVWSL